MFENKEEEEERRKYLNLKELCHFKLYPYIPK
jgi:hypothetical protein